MFWQRIGEVRRDGVLFSGGRNNYTVRTLPNSKAVETARGTTREHLRPTRASISNNITCQALSPNCTANAIPKRIKTHTKELSCFLHSHIIPTTMTIAPRPSCQSKTTQVVFVNLLLLKLKAPNARDRSPRCPLDPSPATPQKGIQVWSGLQGRR